MLNSITLHGRLGKDPELKEYKGLKGPYSKVTFTLAVGRDFGDETDWFFCSMIGKRAEVIDKYFSRGSEIVVTGRMISYKPKNDPDHTAWMVDMTDFDFTGGSRMGHSSAGSTPATTATTTEQSSFDDLPDSFEAAEDDIPF